MIVLRVVGAVFVAGALAALAWDLYRAIQGGALRLRALGELWFALDPGSLNLVQAVTQRYLLPALWDPVLVTVLLWPAAVVLGVLGVLLLLIARRR